MVKKKQKVRIAQLVSRLSRPANDKRTSCRQKGHIPIEIFKTVSCCFQVTRKMNGRSVGKPALVEICEVMANVLQSGFDKRIFLKHSTICLSRSYKNLSVVDRQKLSEEKKDILAEI